MRQSEAPTDDPAVPEELLDLVGMGVGADVEVLGRASQQQIAHAAADEIGRVIEVTEPVQHLQGVRIYQAPGNHVRLAGHDHGLNHGPSL